MDFSGKDHLHIPVLDREQVSDYIADISAKLAQLAKAQDLAALAYLLEMTTAEARGQVECERLGRLDKSRLVG